MADPTVTDYFGTSAQLGVNGESRMLEIWSSDFTGNGLQENNFSDPDKILLALIKKVYAWTAADLTEDPGCEIGAPSKSFTTRNNQPAIAWSYEVTFFVPDNTSTEPDPDEVF